MALSNKSVAPSAAADRSELRRRQQPPRRFLLRLPVADGEDSNMSAVTSGRFMYFAFGSNLLKERLQMSNPSATFYATGRLKDYELTFGLWGQHVENAWHGGVATIKFSPGSDVWGVIWTLKNEHLTSLDNQEGVSKGIYARLEVSVDTDKGPVPCKTYQLINFHASPPSPQYKQVVCLGAEQNHLPKYGVLKRIKNYIVYYESKIKINKSKQKRKPLYY
uniref:Gamma-glutamylcyclotransferase a n=1 Tax=Echeneis naucrates TaxID=173247 RepID=A0A665U1M2_ECHNA